jgi:putative hemolysin
MQLMGQSSIINKNTRMPGTMDEAITVRLARNDIEIKAAQHLRYQVFYEEFGAVPSAEVKEQRRDFDEFDAFADHMVVVDERLGEGSEAIVGTYRLTDQKAALRAGRFYTSDEYDISPLLECGANLLELGRSCVLEAYRTRPVLQKLWQGIAGYVVDKQIEILFGCGSFQGMDPKVHSEALSYLYHYHLAPPGLRPIAWEQHFIEMNRFPKCRLNQKQILTHLPPLIKGYIRLGAHVGDGAFLDHTLNTTDVCIVLQTHLITDRYKRHYERTTSGTFGTPSWADGES